MATLYFHGQVGDHHWFSSNSLILWVSIDHEVITSYQEDLFCYFPTKGKYWFGVPATSFHYRVIRYYDDRVRIAFSSWFGQDPNMPKEWRGSYFLLGQKDLHLMREKKLSLAYDIPLQFWQPRKDWRAPKLSDKEKL